MTDTEIKAEIILNNKGCYDENCTDCKNCYIQRNSDITNCKLRQYKLNLIARGYEEAQKEIENLKWDIKNKQGAIDVVMSLKEQADVQVSILEKQLKKSENKIKRLQSVIDRLKTCDSCVRPKEQNKAWVENDYSLYTRITNKCNKCTNHSNWKSTT